MSAGVIGLIASPANADHNGKPGNHGNTTKPSSKPSDPGGPKPSGGPHATPPGQDKVGICHRTASATNRYIYIEVPREEANGHITGADKSHNRVIMWPAGSTWQGSPRSGPVLDYFANGPASCEDSPGGGQSTVPTLIQTSAGCPNIDGSLSLPSVPAGVSFTVVTLSGGDTVAPFGPGSYRVTVTTTGNPFPNGQQTYTYPDITIAAGTPPPCGPGGSLTDISPAVSFTDPDCENLRASGWTGRSLDLFDYTVTGTPGLGRSITVTAVIEAEETDEYKLAPGATTSFAHRFPSLADLDCVAGEETIVPKPRPEPKPDKEPTVKGVEVIKPPAAPPAAAPAAAPTAVAAGLGDTATASPIQTIAQILVAGGMLLLMAGAWIGLGRREFGTHEA